LGGQKNKKGDHQLRAGRGKRKQHMWGKKKEGAVLQAAGEGRLWGGNRRLERKVAESSLIKKRERQSKTKKI